MSWLNFNESLNSLKGQLSNFASGVLADDVDTEKIVIKENINEVSDVQEKFTNIELDRSSNVVQQEPPDNWSWDSPRNSLTSNSISKDEIICNLQKKVTALETDKRELTLSLEQLDFDCQQTTDKLVTLKDNLQVEYDELKTDFENLKKEYTTVLNENLAKSKEIDLLKTDEEDNELRKLHEENRILNKQLMISLKEVETKNKLVEKYNELQKQCDNHLESLISEKLINEELQKLYNNLEDVNASLTEKLEKYANFENNGSIKEYEGIALNTANVTLPQNSFLKENEELDCLKDEIELLKSNYNLSLSYIDELKAELEESEKLYSLQKESNNEVFAKVEEADRNIETLLQDNKNLTSDCELLKTDIDNMNAHIAQLTKERDTLISNAEDFKKSNEILTNDYKQLRINCDALESTNSNLKMMSQQIPDYQCLQEKCISTISDAIYKIINSNDMTSSTTEEDPIMYEFAQKTEVQLRALLTFKKRCDILENEISEVSLQKNAVIAEKNFEIEKLLKNSEILSQEILDKSQSLKDMEEECAELMKNNDLLITELDGYRKSSNLQTISESNEDNLLLLEIQLENANKRVHDLEATVIDLESSKQDNIEVELIKKHMDDANQELNQTKEEFSELLLHYKQLEEDKLLLKSTLDKTKSDFENTEYKYTELTINVDSFKEESDHLKNKHSDLVAEYQNLLSVSGIQENKISLLEKTEQELKQKLIVEIENHKNKEMEIKNLVERLQNSKMSETSWKLQVDTLHKELQTITDARQNLELKYDQCLNDFERQKEEYVNMKTEQFTTQIGELEQQMKELAVSRDDLINLVRSKHEENVRYHDEIQRLNLHLSSEIEKAIVLKEKLNELSVNYISHDDVVQKDQEIENLKDQNSFVKEKCEKLAHNLLQEQSNVQKVLQERQSAVDRELQLSKELERLREHLVEIEEVYTQELLVAEQKNKEMLMKVNEIEQREKDSNSIYTSVNIRANQQVETLQAQLQLATNQREELRIIVSDLEDKENKQVAALTNLQFVLEQFQRDKDKDVEQETERIRRQIGVEKQIQEELKDEIVNLKLQLEESKQGLQAASRLSDQLEKSKQQAFTYKDEILKLQEQLQSSESMRKDLTSSSDMKVDKTLIKNLVLGYISSNSNDQGQILKIIATVLDFNQKESEKVNLNKPSQGGWLNTILHPQSLRPNQDVNHQSLSEAFVRFLESESQPKVAPNLLMATQQSKDNSDGGSEKPRQSPHTLHEVVLPTFEDFGSSRSSGSILKGILKNNS